MKTITKYVSDSGKEYSNEADALWDDYNKYADDIARMFNVRGVDFTEADFHRLRTIFEGMARQPRKAYRRLLRLRSLVQAANAKSDEIPF